MTRFFLVCFFAFFCFNADALVEVHFTPSKACENRIINAIDEASEQIDVAIYSLTHKVLAEALMKAVKRGVKVRILADRQQALVRGAQIVPLYLAGLDVKVHTVFQKQHNKFAVFDRKKVVSGSYNWTISASYRNAENCLFVSDEPDLASFYQQEFEKLWKINTEEASFLWFKKYFEKKGMAEWIRRKDI